MIYDILHYFFGISFCSLGKCYGGFIENGKLICPKCGKKYDGKNKC